MNSHVDSAITHSYRRNMRIKNKYLRNRAFHNKHWKRVRNQEHPFQNSHGAWWYPSKEQIDENFKSISIKVRVLENGTHKQWIVWNASASFRRLINKERKAMDRNVMNKIRNGNYDLEFDKYRKNATWSYF